MKASEFKLAREALLELHRTLLDAERRDYERVHGRLSDGQFLEAMVKDPYLSWLGALTTMIVALDEIEDRARSQGPSSEWLAGIRELLNPAAGVGEFSRRYHASLQRNPEVVVAHGAVMRALPA